jgi:hypothetical protein
MITLAPDPERGTLFKMEPAPAAAPDHNVDEQRLLQLVQRVFTAMRAGAAWKERNELRADLHRAVDHYFGEALTQKQDLGQDQKQD